MVGYVRFLARIWPALAFCFLCDCTYLFLKLWLGLKSSGAPPIIAIVFPTFALNPFILPTSAMYNPKLSPKDDELSDLAKEMLESERQTPIPVHRLVDSFGKKKINGYYKDGKIFISQKAIDELTPGELRFIVGHEVAHILRLNAEKVGGRNIGIGWLIAALTWLFFAFVIIRLEFGGWQYLPLGLLMLPMVIFAIRQGNSAKAPSPELELWCDAKGAELSGDYPSALTALEKLTIQSSDRASKFSGYPTRERRLNHMRELVKSTENEPITPVSVHNSDNV